MAAIAIAVTVRADADRADAIAGIVAAHLDRQDVALPAAFARPNTTDS